MNYDRRTLLSGVLTGAVAGLAGCVDTGIVGDIRGESESESSASSGGETGSGADGATSESGSGGTATGDVPVADERLYLAYDTAELRGSSLSGGVGQDGIPSVDDPRFRPIGEADLDDGEPVFGVVRNGEARAYPQYVLVWHEIVNDAIAGDPVAVTYCPLTGTAQGFERGDTEFGVSGRLVNSTLIMYDRATESRWPQMLATGIDGPLEGATLREFRVVWTTFGEWRAAHPDSEILTDETGYARRYGNDPYGSYDPLERYYRSDSTMFRPLSTPEHGHRKSVVIGARTGDGAVAFDKETLLAERVLEGSVPDGGEPAGGGSAVVAVAEPTLSTGYVYRNPDGLAVDPDGSRYRIDGHSGAFGAPDLPLDRVLAFDAMWFAWAGFYPDTAFVGEHTEAGYGR